MFCTVSLTNIFFSFQQLCKLMIYSFKFGFRVATFCLERLSALLAFFVTVKLYLSVFHLAVESLV